MQLIDLVNVVGKVNIDTLGKPKPIKTTTKIFVVNGSIEHYEGCYTIVGNQLMYFWIHNKWMKSRIKYPADFLRNNEFLEVEF